MGGAAREESRWKEEESLLETCRREYTRRDTGKKSKEEGGNSWRGKHGGKRRIWWS